MHSRSSTRPTYEPTHRSCTSSTPSTSFATLHARGFTLIEIMVVVVIIGILAALVAPAVMSRIDDAAITKAKQDIRAYETALNLFRIDNFKYPTTEQGLEALKIRP